MNLRRLLSPDVMMPAFIVTGVVGIFLVITLTFMFGASGDEHTVSANRVEWEEISRDFSSVVYRTEVPGGWLVRTNSGQAVTFVADPEHEWLK